MEQPRVPISAAAGTGAGNEIPQQKSQNQNLKMPSPQKLISHYEAKGLSSQEASMKVIEDLQSVVMKLMSSERGRKDRLISDTSRKVDSTNNRLAILEMKLDSKPGYAETFAIGLASGAALPPILWGLAQIWNVVTSITKTNPPSSPSP